MNKDQTPISSEGSDTGADVCDTPIRFVKNVRTLLDATADVDMEAAAVLCGMNGATPAFRSMLHQIPAPERNYTVGEVAEAYLSAMLASLRATRSMRAG